MAKRTRTSEWVSAAGAVGGAAHKAENGAVGVIGQVLALGRAVAGRGEGRQRRHRALAEGRRDGQQHGQDGLGGAHRALGVGREGRG